MSNFKVEYVYELLDKFTPIAKKIKAETTAMTTNMVWASTATEKFYDTHLKGIDKMSKKFEHVGRKMSMWVTLPIIGIGALAIREYGKQEEAIKRVEVALQGSALAGKVSADELYKNAQRLMRTTGADEDAIMGVTQRIVTMRGITKDTAMRIQNTSVDVAKFLGTDASGAIEKMQKVFMGNARALKEMNINMTPQQKKVLDHLRNTNQQEKVRLFLLDRIEEKVKGQALEASKVGTGPLKVTMALLTDMLKEFGEPLLNFMNRNLFPVLKSLITLLTSFSPVGKGFVLFLAGSLSMIGPLTLGIAALMKGYIVWKEAIVFLRASDFILWLGKLQFATKALAAMQGILNVVMMSSKLAFLSVITGLRASAVAAWQFAIALYANPITWIVAGLLLLGVGIYYAYKNWDKIKKAFMETTWAKVLISYLNYVFNILKNVWSFISGIYSKVSNMIGSVLSSNNTINGSVTQHVTGVVNQSLHTSNKSDVNITLNAPKGTVKQVTTKTNGAGLRLGYNMGGQ